MLERTPQIVRQLQFYPLSTVLPSPVVKLRVTTLCGHLGRHLEGDKGNPRNALALRFSITGGCANYLSLQA